MTQQQILALAGGMRDVHDLRLMCAGIFCGSQASEVLGPEWTSWRRNGERPELKTDVERGVELEFFLEDGDQDTSGDGVPSLRLDRVLGGSAQTELDGGCIRELRRIACDGHFAWNVPSQG
jgi:hypothetical protein